MAGIDEPIYGDVSTHSRAKAAGLGERHYYGLRIGFNTQPREGGWTVTRENKYGRVCFNTQPREGGW